MSQHSTINYHHLGNDLHVFPLSALGVSVSVVSLTAFSTVVSFSDDSIKCGVSQHSTINYYHLGNDLHVFPLSALGVSVSVMSLTTFSAFSTVVSFSSEALVSAISHPLYFGKNFWSSI